MVHSTASQFLAQNMAINTRLLSFLLLLTASIAAVSVSSSITSTTTAFLGFFFSLTLFWKQKLQSDDDCVYTMYIRTGSIFRAGTDSIISVRLYDTYGEYVGISDLVSWGGLMGPKYNYFERGNLDIFSGIGPCLSSSVCALNLTSDGSGMYHGWYCNYVEVTTTAVHKPCLQQKFKVDQWLARDEPPYNLTVIKNYCNSNADDLKGPNGVNIELKSIVIWGVSMGGD